MSFSCELIGGPQDGAKVRTGSSSGMTPFQEIYLGPKWLGDGHAAWSTEPSDRFPYRYVRDDGLRYRFAPLPPEAQ